MKAETRKIFDLGTFFTLKKKIDKKYIYKIEPSSKIILRNIHISWLRSIYAKTHSNFPVYLNVVKKNYSCYGIITKTFHSYPEELTVAEEENDYSIANKLGLNLTLTVPKTDIMQYFFQWQRYRKYWWSSTTTTPSLFALKDMKYGSTTVDTQIVAKFHCGERVVENVSINTENNISDKTASLSCSMGLETALCTLMLDGVLSQTKNGYLRLHNKMAPYKISFALNCRDTNNMHNLEKLATLVYSKLNARQISTWFPNFSLPLQAQIEENLQKGVTYTAILNDETLSDGILQLLNSSTMLKEQVHLADFENYAALICRK